MVPTPQQILADPVGRYPATTVAAFDPTRGELPRRELDPGRTVAFLERLAEAQVPAVLIASSTGQGHLRTVDELEAWLACAAEARLGETARIALLRPEDGEAVNARLLDRLADWGYPVVFFRPGTDLPPGAGDDAVVANLAPCVQAAARRGLAIGLYTIPDVSGTALTPEAAARLLKGVGGDNIAAIKVTEADFDASTARFLAHPDLEHLKIVQGWDPHLARALRAGPACDAGGRQRAGITSGLMSLALHQYQHILAQAAEEDWDEVERAQRAASAIFASMQDSPGSFADLQRAKYVMGLGHPLTGEVTGEQVERIFAALDGLEREADRARIARGLDLMGDGPFHGRLAALAGE